MATAGAAGAVSSRCADMTRAFTAWKHYPDRLVGFVPRRIMGDPVTYQLIDPGTDPGQYNQVLASSAFLHVDWLAVHWLENNKKGGLCWRNVTESMEPPGLLGLPGQASRPGLQQASGSKPPCQKTAAELCTYLCSAGRRGPTRKMRRHSHEFCGWQGVVRQAGGEAQGHPCPVWCGLQHSTTALEGTHSVQSGVCGHFRWHTEE